MTDVTVIVPTRDRPKLLRRALASIAAQKPPGPGEAAVARVVVVFDQSPPDRGLPTEFPQLRIDVIPNHRKPGLAGARNSGIDVATTEWVAFCDDDDWWAHDKIGLQLDVAHGFPDADFIVGSIVIAIGDRRIARKTEKTKITFSDLIRSRVMEAHPSTFLVRRMAIEDYIGPVDEELAGGYAEDYDWLLRAARKTPVVVASSAVTYVQWHTRSFFGSRWSMIDRALDQLLVKYPEFSDDPVGRARIEGQRAFAQAALGERRRALATVRRTVACDWRQPRAYLALLVVARFVSPDRLVGWMNRLGRGI